VATVREHESLLVERFVASFEKLDEMIAWDHDSVACQLVTGDPNQFGHRRWQPTKVDTDLEMLEPIYSKLPARFPPIFERLVLSYRWAEIDLQSCRLLANPPGRDLGGLFEQMSKDAFLWNCLLRAGYIRFGLGTDIDYDPVCFDISSRKKNRDCRIVKIDHEQILCNDRVKVIAEIAPSFESLVVRAIDQANHP
jgi:hypothetical protein